mgnify:FL=1
MFFLNKLFLIKNTIKILHSQNMMTVEYQILIALNFKITKIIKIKSGKLYFKFKMLNYSIVTKIIKSFKKITYLIKLLKILQIR